MVRKPCCSKEGLNRGAWTAEEDKILSDCIKLHGEGRWRSLPKKAGLKRCGKSCRLRWLNYLRPDIKRGNISEDEEELIIRLHKLLGNRWSLIAGRLPGRTDNEIKNYWNTILSKKITTRTFNQKTKLPAKPNHVVPPRTNTVQCLSEPLLPAPKPTNRHPVGLPSNCESGKVDPFQPLLTETNYNNDLFTDLELGFDIGELDLANLLNTTDMLSSASPACSSDHQPVHYLDCCIEEQLWLG